ncbi:MAG: PAS domain S-box protein [Proteobacteria bacterium]|nr:PAS domain S-box protein [Pseudomonadota bacterium]
MKFLTGDIASGLMLETVYSPVLVFLSVVIAFFASYVALCLADRIRAVEHARMRFVWFGFGGLIMGSGVWAMHFIGMLAVSLPVPIRYDATITALSIVPAVLASGVALYILSLRDFGKTQLVTGGLIMGAGVGIMHYFGMSAMQMAAVVYYDPVIFVASFLVAFLLGIFALGIRQMMAKRFPTVSKVRVTLVAALLMGVAIAGMHYTAMAAANFVPIDVPTDYSGGTDPLILAGVVAGAILIILFGTIAIAYLNARFKAAGLLKQREVYLNTIEDTMVDGLVVINQTGIIQSVNKAALEIFGYSEKELIDKNILILMRGKYYAKHDADLSNYIKNDKTYIQDTSLREIQAFTKNGQAVDIEMAINKTKFNGETLYVHSLRDISQRKKAEAIAEKANEELRQAQKMEAIGNLAGGIAHDFNNLLTAIKGSFSLMKMDGKCEDEETRDLIELGQNAANRGADLTHRLLAFSRKQTLKPTLVDINELVKEFFPLIKRTLGATTTIEINLMDRAGHIEIDPHQLENSLLNLAINAHHAMPEGGHLIIETKDQEVTKSQSKQNKIKAGKYIVLSVSDNGCGMPPMVRDKIFEPFFTTKPKGEGTGLGLSMVYGFVKQSDGYIRVTSELGVGTTFKIYLPEKQWKKQEIKQKNKTASLPAKEKGIILVVEDDIDIQTVVTRGLRAKGHTVLKVDDGPSAIKLIAKTSKIDLLFTDVVLPKGLDGLAIAKIFQKKFPESKIIFTSGYPGKDIQRKGLLETGVQFLPKPYDLEEVFELIHSNLKGKTRQKKK